MSIETRAIEPLVIAGAGGLGSVYAGMLALAGVDVIVLAHGAHDAALRTGELTLRLPTGSRATRVRAARRAEGRTLILTSRVFDTDAVLDRVDGTPTIALSLQNGLRKNEALVRRYGDRTVLIRGVSSLAAELLVPGVAESVGLGQTLLERSTPEVAQLVDALRGAGIPTQVADDGASAEWSKLAQVVAMMGLQAVTRQFLHSLMQSTDGALLFRQMSVEMSTLAAQKQVELRDWPGLLPVRTLADSTPEEAVEFLHASGERMEEAGATERRTSLLRALEADRRTELEDIHGEVVRYAASAEVRVPTVETCYRLARLTMPVGE